MSKIIFCVDDSNVIRTNLELILQNAGYQVIQAEDGLIAQKVVNEKILAQNIRLSLVLCDINMPNCNGLEFLQWFKSQEKLKIIPVIMLTTETEISMMHQAKQYGASGWIIKPFEEDQLLNVIKKFVK